MYPQVEFFSFDIAEPGNAESSEELNQGEYGTLAIQLEVGYTPSWRCSCCATKSTSSRTCSRGTSSGASSTTHCSIFRARTSGNSSRVDVILGQVELTESGSGVEYFTSINHGDFETDLLGFTLNAVDRETGRPGDATAGIQIIGAVRLVLGQEASLRRAPDVVDTDGD